MKIVIISATDFEIAPVKEKIQSKKNVDIVFKTTGVGMLATAVFLSKIIYEDKPDFIIQAGIAGCFDNEIPLAKVVLIDEEFIGDLGVDENGKWKDIFDLKLAHSNKKPFNKKGIFNKYAMQFLQHKLPVVKAITVNQITTENSRIEQLVNKYQPIVESMEGAALHYLCNFHQIPYLQIRAISNYVGERDKSKWQIKKAIENLNIALLKVVKQLNKS